MTDLSKARADLQNTDSENKMACWLRIYATALLDENERLLSAIAAFVNNHRGHSTGGIDELDELRNITYEAGLFEDQIARAALGPINVQKTQMNGDGHD
jgi:hypothetical protein